MRRREFIAGLGSAAAWPLKARAQQPAVPVMGYLTASSPDAYAQANLGAFRAGLGELGFIDGRNVGIVFKWAERQYDRLPELAADLVRRQVKVIYATGAANAALAAKNATTTIPIVFNVGGDPVELGLVSRLNRPNNNLTGVTTISRELLAKKLEILRELLPSTTKIGLLVNPGNSNSDISVRDIQVLAAAGGLILQTFVAASEAQIEAVFLEISGAQVGGLLVATDGLLIAQSDQIASQAMRYGIPVIHSVREFAVAGGLISYGSINSDAYRQSGIYVGRILRGEKPADLPVMRPTKFNFVLNLKTAKTLGLEVPTSILLRADEVIE
jgi:putative tryptophan/tyrosine transport system substrate-binding protein